MRNIQVIHVLDVSRLPSVCVLYFVQWSFISVGNRHRSVNKAFRSVNGQPTDRKV
jgi:hypothetical protein